MVGGEGELEDIGCCTLQRCSGRPAVQRERRAGGRDAPDGDSVSALGRAAEPELFRALRVVKLDEVIPAALSHGLSARSCTVWSQRQGSKVAASAAAAGGSRWQQGGSRAAAR